MFYANVEFELLIREGRIPQLRAREGRSLPSRRFVETGWTGFSVLRLYPKHAVHVRKLKLVVQRERRDNLLDREIELVCWIEVGKDDGGFEVVVEERDERSMLRVWWGREVSVSSCNVK